MVGKIRFYNIYDEFYLCTIIPRFVKLLQILYSNYELWEQFYFECKENLSKECTFLDDKIKKVDLVSIKCGFIEKWTIQAIIKNKINGLCWFFYDSCVSIIFMLGRVKNKCTRSKQTNYFTNKEIPQIN